MIILLHGEDTYRSKKKLREIIEEYKGRHKSGFNLRFLEGKDMIFEDLKSEMFGISMFKEKKLLVLFGSSLNSKLRDSLSEKGDVFSDSENVLILFEERDLPKRDKVLSFADKHGKTQQFNFLKEADLKKWAKQRFASLGRDVSDGAVDKIVELVGGDLWQMDNEIQKLSSYSPKTVDVEGVEMLVKPNSDLNIFETIDAISAKDKKKAVRLLRLHIEKGDAPIYLLAMIASQIRNMISVKQSDSNPGMSPFVAMKSMRQSKNFSMGDLKRIYERILELDSDIKVGRIEQETALDILISEI